MKNIYNEVKTFIFLKKKEKERKNFPSNDKNCRN